MPQQTNIEWTATPLPDGTLAPGFTSNPVKYRDKATGRTVWACVRHSSGCQNCYAEALAKRYNRGGPFTKTVTDGVEPYLCEKELKALLRSKDIAGRKVFLGDMTDCFGSWVTDAMLDRLFAVLVVRRDVTWQLLTKRADRMAAYLTDPTLADRLHEAVKHRTGYDHPDRPAVNRATDALAHCWFGFSAEDQDNFDRRAQQMTPAMRAGFFVWVSAEPLLGPLDMTRVPSVGGYATDFLRGEVRGTITRDIRPLGGRLSWCVVGGESGPGARRCELGWIRRLVHQCREASVPAFVKQLGACAVDATNGVAGASLKVPAEAVPLVSLRLKNRKGGEMSEWPASLRTREFPAVEAVS